MPGWNTLIADKKSSGAFYGDNKFHQVVADVAQSPAAQRIAADDDSRHEVTEIERTAWAHRRATAAVLKQPREKKEVYVGHHKDMNAEEYVAAGGDIHTFHLYEYVPHTHLSRLLIHLLLSQPKPGRHVGQGRAKVYETNGNS